MNVVELKGYPIQIYSHNRFVFSSTHKSSVDWPRGVNKRQSTVALPPLQSVKIPEQVRERLRNLHSACPIRHRITVSLLIRFFIRWLKLQRKDHS
jgi:hypothetical protein